MGRPSDARERLITAANDVIYAQSYAAVTVDALCAAAGVTKSSFYHFFSSKQDLVLRALDAQWQRLEALVLQPAFGADLPPDGQVLRFFDLMQEGQQRLKGRTGHMNGCPIGNLTLELSTQDEPIRLRLEYFWRQWRRYFERAIARAQAEGCVPADLDVTAIAETLLAYIEGVVLLAKGRNDPALIGSMRTPVRALMQYQEARAA